MDLIKPFGEKSLDVLVEISILAMDGVDIKFGQTSPFGSVIFPDNTSEDLTGYQALYMEYLFTFGYAERSELWKKFHPNSEIRLVDVVIKHLRRKIGKDSKGNDIIQTRYGSGRHEGGYFIGKLEHHRNEPENIVEAYGYTLNTITGCLRIPGREEPVVLTTLQTQYMEHFFAVGYSSRNELWKKFHPNSEIRSVDVVIKRLRQNIGKDSAGNDIIQTRVGSGGYDGGYFIGKLEHHRNEPENIVDIYGHKLSVLTGFLRLLDRKEPVFLTSLQTKYIEHLFHAGPATNERLRNEFHPNTTSASVKTFIQHLNKGIGKDSDGNHFLKGDFNHRLGNFAYYININYGTGK